MTAPAHLRLPFALQVRELLVDTLQIDDQPPLARLRTGLQLGAEAGRQHRIDNLDLRSERARLRGTVRIDAEAPMLLLADVSVESLIGTPWKATLQATGPFARLEAKARLRGKEQAGAAPALDAHAHIEPFATWPLPALELSTRDLDLAALWSDAPSTRIDAHANVQSAGLDHPAHATVRVDNHEPGRWDCDDCR